MSLASAVERVLPPTGPLCLAWEIRMRDGQVFVPCVHGSCIEIDALRRRREEDADQDALASSHAHVEGDMVTPHRGDVDTLRAMTAEDRVHMYGCDPLGDMDDRITFFPPTDESFDPETAGPFRDKIMLSLGEYVGHQSRNDLPVSVLDFAVSLIYDTGVMAATSEVATGRRQAVRPSPLETCTTCGARVRADNHGTLVDQSGGDVCTERGDDAPHMLHDRHGIPDGD